jgi:hypothetical protein
MDVDTFNYPSRLPLPTFVDPTYASMDPCVDRPWKGAPIFGSPVLNWLVPHAHIATTWQENPAPAPNFSYLVAIKSVEQTIQGDRTHYDSQNKVNTKIDHGATLRVLSP